MDSTFKPDVGEAIRRWDDYWIGRNARPTVLATLPKPGVEPLPAPGYGAAWSGNYDEVIDRYLQHAETHDFLGDSIPCLHLEFAPAHFAALLGADLIFPDCGCDSGWAVPFVDDWADIELQFCPESEWWGKTVAYAERIKARCGDAVMIGSPTLCANLDALEAVRGGERLLMDLIDCPELVHKALEQVTRAYEQVLAALSELLEYERRGSMNIFRMYCSERTNRPQCDFSAMISPEMFRDFVQPYLKRELELLDGPAYHLDGPGAVCHLDALCEIKPLRAIQWVAGAGEAGKQDWAWLYDKIDRLGKGTFRSVSPEELLELSRTQENVKKTTFVLRAETRDEVERCLEELEQSEIEPEN